MSLICQKRKLRKLGNKKRRLVHSIKLLKNPYVFEFIIALLSLNVGIEKCIKMYLWLVILSKERQ